MAAFDFVFFLLLLLQNLTITMCRIVHSYFPFPRLNTFLYVSVYHSLRVHVCVCVCVFIKFFTTKKHTD